MLKLETSAFHCFCEMLIWSSSVINFNHRFTADEWSDLLIFIAPNMNIRGFPTPSFRINQIQKWLLWQLVIGNRALGFWAHETLLLS